MPSSERRRCSMSLSDWSEKPDRYVFDSCGMRLDVDSIFWGYSFINWILSSSSARIFVSIPYQESTFFTISRFSYRRLIKRNSLGG